MKNIIQSIVFALTLVFLFSSCEKDKCTQTYTHYDPIFLSYEEIRHEIYTQSPHELTTPGKLYVYNDLLFINELYQGVHIYDNTNPSNPKSIGFIEIIGNVDIAIKNGFMYADNYTDLVTIDITNPMQTKLVCRDENVYNFYGRDNMHVVIGYQEIDSLYEVDCDLIRDSWNKDIFLEIDMLSSSNLNKSSASSNNGYGGSLARFTIVGNYLYVIDDYKMKVYNVESPNKPIKENDINVGWGIETLFAYNANMFIGANDGMHIYSLQNPSSPMYLSTFNHANACDPVVVDENIAYVTLRSGRQCESFSNQLDVIDVSDIRHPKLIESFEMRNPQGLTYIKDRLFICEREFGLKIFDKTIPSETGNKEMGHLKSIHAVDVAPLSEKLLLVVGDNGFHQFDISNPDQPKELSVINVRR